jgi:hypothetical protein
MTNRFLVIHDIDQKQPIEEGMLDLLASRMSSLP